LFSIPSEFQIFFGFFVAMTWEHHLELPHHLVVVSV